MPVSAAPPPSQGSLSPSGFPPSVAVTLTAPGPIAFTVILVTPRGGRVIEAGVLPGGHSHLPVFLPSPVPPGSTLVIDAGDGSCTGQFVYQLS